jgi:hypothetical protein
MTNIQQINETTYTANNGKGTELTLIKSAVGYWTVIASNAATRAYRSLGMKTFWSLAEVEAKYKTFRGLAALIDG